MNSNIKGVIRICAAPLLGFMLGMGLQGLWDGDELNYIARKTRAESADMEHALRTEIQTYEERLRGVETELAACNRARKQDALDCGNKIKTTSAYITDYCVRSMKSLANLAAPRRPNEEGK